ncbi:MAG: GMC family oxidoreductase N-terminal domain-containing protein [Myxococcales bacterium]
MVAALADTVMPPGERVRREAGPIVAERMDALLAGLPWAVRFGIVAGLFIVEWSALLLGGGRFSRLPAARRLAVLDRWHHGHPTARLILRGLLTPLKAAFYSDDGVAAELGYRPKTFTPRLGALDGLPPGDIRIGRERGPEEIRCEVAVIGSGAGGAVVAKELAERGRRVVIVEEGQYWTRPQFTRRSFDMSRLLYRDLGFTLALGRPGIPIPLGKTVGGTTTINSGTCFRVPEHTLERWRREHDLGLFTAEALAPFYDRVEAMIRVQPVPEAVWGRTARLIQRGADSLGLRAQPIARNAEACRGSGVCCFGCPEDAKRSMNVSYVPAALAAGATLYTETRAAEILLDGARARGLICEMGPEGTPLRVRADAVVVAAGTAYTPLVLEPQGVGRRSGQLGRNLSIHPATKVAALFDEPVLSWDGVPQGAYIHDLAGEGVLFEGSSMTPDFTAVGLPFYGPKLAWYMDRYPNLASFGLMVEDDSQGWVRRGPDGRPLLWYRLGRAEVERLRRGVEVLSRIFFRAGAQVVLPPLGMVQEMRSETEVDRLRSLRLIPEDIEVSAFHPLGTCRLGLDPRRSVLDPDLESWEVDGLFVADGSIFPSSLGVNPQLTIMAFATRAAGRIDERLAGDRRRWVS